MDDVHSLLVVVNELNPREVHRLPRLLNRFAQHSDFSTLELIYIQPNLPIWYATLPSSVELDHHINQYARDKLHYLQRRLHQYWQLETRLLFGPTVETLRQTLITRPNSTVIAQQTIVKGLRRRRFQHCQMYSHADLKQCAQLLGSKEPLSPLQAVA